MLLLLPQDTVISEQIVCELSMVQKRFSQQLASDLDCVNDLVKHIERYHGKMLRPALVLTTGMASSADGQSITEEHRTVATVVEMTHLASLAHDDVLDDAEIRRRGVTVNYLKGNETAIMLGDYLFSHAYTLCSNLDLLKPARLIAQTTNVIVAGELLQLANRDNLELDEQTYFDIVRRKTGSLCGVCCQLGVSLNGCDDEMARSLYDYGEKLGIAFQIIDDLLDLTGNQETVGKTLGRDLEKQKMTLPLIDFLAKATGRERAGMVSLIQNHTEGGSGDKSNGNGNGEFSQQIGDMLKASGSIQYANAQAVRLIDEAKQALSVLPDGPAKALLSDMAEAVVTRDF